MLMVDAILNRLMALGYDRDSANWLFVKHMTCGTLDILTHEIKRMEDDKDAV